jgi:ATP-dependent protease ClpP protease subunit
MRRRWYEFRAQVKGAEIVIYDEIGAFGIPAKAFLDKLKALGPVAELTVRINSPGGSVFDWVAIYNALKRHNGVITVWIDGIAASIASMIAMAGDDVVMPENAMLVLHDPSGLVAGTASDMRAMAEALDRMKAGMVAAYRDKSSRNEAEIETLMAAETWLSAQEAVELGLADRVEAPVRMAAHFDLSRFRNTPPQLVALAATPSPQEDDMSEFKKSQPAQAGTGCIRNCARYATWDRCRHAHASGQRAGRRPRRPCLDTSGRVAACGGGGHSAPRTASASDSAGDRPGRGPRRRAQGDARLCRRGARAVCTCRAGRPRRRLHREGDASRAGPPGAARGPRRRGRGHRHSQPRAACLGRAGAACDRHRGHLRRPQPALPIGGIHARAQ